jgi:predicted acylesterase/phospholipase RssA
MQKHFTRLALGGGGMKGLLQVGALTELSKHQPLEFPEGVYGSSIGSIIGTYVAFGLPIDNLFKLYKKHFSTTNAFTPSIGIYDISNCLSSKGLFSMTHFEKNVCAFFDEAKLDIRGKVLGDANMPLHVIASNVTKGRPTILSKNVPIIEALKCSCCVPGVFKPQTLYGQVYVDGDFFSPNISGVIPLSPDTLIVTLPRQKSSKVTPENISSISSFDFAVNLISMATRQVAIGGSNQFTLALIYPPLNATSDINKLDTEDIMKFASTKLRRFLLTKSTH